MKFYFIAGENSGDFIGAKIINSLKEITSNDKTEGLFYGVGGPQMEAAGIKSLFNFQQINLMGFFEVLPHIFTLKKLINNTVENIINNGIEVLITIDSPGFTFRVAQKVKKLAPNIKLIHIVAPSVWAYKESRAKKYAKLYDKLLTLFPFEPPYFTKYGLDAESIGHPIFEQNFYINSKEERDTLNIAKNEKIIAITPGSRKGEIARHMPVIREALDILSSTYKITVIFIQLNDTYIDYISTYLIGAKFNFQFSTERLKSFAVSEVVLAKSGTNTLEIAASNTPMIIGYKLNIFTFFLLKIFIKIKYACIINIIANKEIIPEYIQSEFNIENTVYALSDLLSNTQKRHIQTKRSKEILETIGFNNKQMPSRKAAQIILSIAIDN